MPQPTIDDVIEKIQATTARLTQADTKSMPVSPDTYLWGGPPGEASLDLDSLAVLELPYVALWLVQSAGELLLRQPFCFSRVGEKST